MGKKEYVKCVLTGRYNESPEFDDTGKMTNPGIKDNKSWCGRKINTSLEWTFEDPTHVINNAICYGRLLACGDCSKAIVEALIKGSDNE